MRYYWAIFSLFKARLSFFVALSGLFGYLLGVEGVVHGSYLMGFFIGGFFVAASAAAWNECWEANIDRQMQRTKKRPLASQRMSLTQGGIYAFFSGIIGLAILGIFFNLLTATLALVSLLLYTCLYTPMKKKGVIAVGIGALPGAMPPLLGWCAARGDIQTEAWLLFTIQFLWQFPHFWVIAWMSHKDYARVGFRLLPEKNPGKKSATYILITTFLLVLISVLPWGHHSIEIYAITALANLVVLRMALTLWKKMKKQDIKHFLWAMLIYLPLIQLLYVLDRWIFYKYVLQIP